MLESPSRTQAAGRIQAPAMARPGLRIFVVENHDDTRILLCILLTQMGHTVYSAATMHEALRSIPSSQCDVLISDIGLPDGDGWELMERLNGRRPRLAIAMSGRGMSGDHAKSRAAGYQHHLVKPTGPEELSQILERAQREPRYQRQAETA